MDLGLTNRTAFVAGASKGLGKAAARELAQEGCRVALCSRDEARITDAADDIRAGTEAEVLPLVCDVTDEAQVEAAIAETVDTFGDLHVLVTNAGGPPSGAATEVEPSDYREAVELNLMSTIALCDAALPHLRTAAETDRHARIVMVTSVSAKQPIPTLALSNTARAGGQGYAKSLADDLGPTGITVNTVLPGYTRTQRPGRVRYRGGHAGRRGAEQARPLAERVPVMDLAKFPKPTGGKIKKPRTAGRGGEGNGPGQRRW